MDALVIAIAERRGDITVTLNIVENDEKRWFGDITGVTLKDVEWFIKANTSEHTTEFFTEVS